MQPLKQAVYGAASAKAGLSQLLYSASIQQVSLLPGYCRKASTALSPVHDRI